MIIDSHSHPFGPTGKGQPFQFPIRSRNAVPPGAEAGVKDMLGRHLAVMDRLGIEKRVYVPVPPQSNDFVAKAVARYPDRFIGYAYVYIAEGDELKQELDEMERSVKDLNLKGFKIYPVFHGKTMSAPELRPIFEKANELKVPVLLDTLLIVRGFVEMEGYQLPEWRIPVSTGGLRYDAHNPARLVFSDVMDGLDDLIVILAHFGGGLWMYQHWPSIHNDMRDKAFGVNWGGMPMHRFKKFYYDMCYPYPLDTPHPPCPGGQPSMGPNWFYELFIRIVGEDRILWGTDSTFYPEVVAERTKRELEMIASLDIDPEARDKILWKNAVRLLKLDLP